MNKKQPVSVAGIEFDAVIESTELYSSSVPDYPVDSGYSVSDNMALDPTELDMTLYVTATPVTCLHSHGTGEERLRLIRDELISLYETRQMFSIITPEDVFDNMVISSMEIGRTPDNGYAMEIPITFRQVTVTTAAVNVISDYYARSGATMQTTGSASRRNIGNEILSGRGINTTIYSSATRAAGGGH